MDRHIQMIIFAAFGLLLNFVFQSQQSNAAFLVLLMHYQQAFQRLVCAVRRRRDSLNRSHLRNRPSHRHFEKTAARIPRFHYKNHRKKGQVDREKNNFVPTSTC